MPGDSSGASVLVAGAGLAGLAAARDLVALGATVTVVDARERVGGRVQTIRSGFADSQHGEAGGDFIEEDHDAVRGLARELGLKLAPILRSGWAYVRPDANGRVRLVARGMGAWERLAEALTDVGNRYKLAERRWDSPITAEIARHSVADWLQSINADQDLQTLASGLRGFFLADPEDLSLLALVDQFAGEEAWAPGPMYRVEGGNDRLATVMATALGERVQLDSELVAVSHRGRGVRASVRHKRTIAQMQVDYVIFAMPASLLRRVPITPALPAPQHDAISRLSYGRATKTLLQFSKRFWRSAGRPRAFGSPLPFGAVWDGNEEQRGRAGILAIMAGGSASAATHELVVKDGIDGLVRSLDWLGSRQQTVVASKQIVWEADPWSRGGYAFFDPAFDPSLRAWLARPSPPLFFAGEHTSYAGQGYMNGAVESGRRAAAEVAATRRLAARATNDKT